jgi:hypothetical protein
MKIQKILTLAAFAASTLTMTTLGADRLEGCYLTPGGLTVKVERTVKSATNWEALVNVYSIDESYEGGSLKLPQFRVCDAYTIKGLFGDSYRDVVDSLIVGNEMVPAMGLFLLSNGSVVLWLDNAPGAMTKTECGDGVVDKMKEMLDI